MRRQTESTRRDPHPFSLAGVRASLRGDDPRRSGAALGLYLFVVVSHLLEHLIQLWQVHALGWAPRDAGGLLGLRFDGLAQNEVLHSGYNSLQLTGLILLLPAFHRVPAARRWWLTALALQSWHWLEHAFLQVQVLSGHYFYGALKQMSVLERFFPRVELHFAYNAAVFIPTAIAVVLYLRARARDRRDVHQR